MPWWARVLARARDVRANPPGPRPRPSGAARERAARRGRGRGSAFEEGTKVIATLASHAGAGTGSTQGPTTGTENVMCLSCHRAHASAFGSMTRWDNSTEYITEGGGYRADANGILTSAQYLAAMYDRPATAFAVTQRSLCNKCHAKD